MHTTNGHTGHQSAYIPAQFSALRDSNASLARADDSEHLVVATCWKKGLEPVHAAKTVERQPDGTWHGVKSPFPAGNIYPHLFEVDDIYTVLEAIERLATSKFEQAPSLLYGQLTAWAMRQLETGAERIPRQGGKTFADVPQHLHFLDIDSIIAPKHIKLSDPVSSWGLWLREAVLPPEFHDTSLIAMASGSHGTTHKSGRPVPRLRVIMWLRTPITIAAFKRYAEHRLVPHLAEHCEFVGDSPLDTSIYTPGHLIFCAPPTIIGDGTPYPHRRIALIDGLWGDDVILPEYKVAHTAPRTKLRPVATDRSDPAGIPFATIDGCLAAITPEQSNRPILKACWLLANACANQDQVRAGVNELEPRIIERLREVSEPGEFERRYREEIEGGKLLKSALAAFKKQSGMALVPQIDTRPAVECPSDPAKELAVKRDVLMTQMQRDVTACLDGDAQRRCILYSHGAGFGKTEAALRAAMSAVYRDRAFVVIAVPNTKLAKEVYERAREHSRKYLAEIWGLSVDEADAETARHIILKQGRRQLCAKLDEYEGQAAAALEQVSISPIKSVCASCGGCDWPSVSNAWRRAREEDRQRLVIMVHADLVTTLKRTVSRPDDESRVSNPNMPDLIIIDECPAATLTGGPRERQISALSTLPLGGLSKHRLEGKGRSVSTADLIGPREALASVLRQTNGRLKCADLPGLLADTQRIVAAIGDERDGRRVYYDEMQRAVEEKKPIDALARFGRELQIANFYIDMYRAIRESIECPARDEVFGISTFDSQGQMGKSVRCSVRHRLPYGPNYILLDGSAASVEDIGAYFGAQRPNMAFEHRHDHAPPGAYRLTQIPTKLFSLTMLLRGLKDHGVPSTHGNASLAILHRYINMLAAKWRGVRDHTCAVDVLLVCQKPIARTLNEISLPDNVAIETLGNLRGLDRYRDVPCLIVVGRIAAPIPVIEAQAEAIHFDDRSVAGFERVEPGSWPMQKQVLPAKGNMAPEVRAEVHPDPHCERVRRRISEDEVRQAIARARLHDRAEGNWCDLHVFGSTHTGLLIDEALTWQQAKPTLAQMAEAHGIWFRSHDSANAAYGTQSVPDGDFKAENKTLWQGVSSLTGECLEYITLENPPFKPTHKSPLNLCQYRKKAATPSGRRPRIEQALVDISRLPKEPAARQQAAIAQIERLIGTQITDFSWLEPAAGERPIGITSETSRLGGTPPSPAATHIAPEALQ